MDDLLVALTMITALGCGLSAGALFAFSSFVMRALARLPAAQGIAAMQSINVVAVTPVFMTALFGTALACVALAVWALADWHDSFRPYLLAGSALYLVGTIGLTMALSRAAQQRARGRRADQPRRRRRTGDAMSRTGRAGTTSGLQRP